MKTNLLLILLLSAGITISQAQTDVLSSKKNEPVKKESFSAKVDRYKKEGFKVAVVFDVSPLATTKPSSSSSGPSMGSSSSSPSISLDGNIEFNKQDFISLAESYVAQMNAAFNTDIFELVDPSTIPVKATRFGDTPDWGITKYKMVASQVVNPVYQFDKFGDKYTAKFLVNQYAIIAEYVNDKKGIKIKYPVRAGDLGFYTMTFDESDQLAGLSTVEELHAIVNPPVGTELAALLQEAMDEKMPDYIAKRKKK